MAELPDFMYMDDDKPRSKYIEHMFEAVFFGRHLDALFRENFETYVRTFFAIEDVPIEIYTDESAALKFVSIFGLVSVTPICDEYRADPDFVHCEFQSVIHPKAKALDAYKGDLKCSPTCAPTVHRAILLAFIEFLREITVAHISYSKENE